VKTDWCIDQVQALDEGACYVLPDEPTRTLLIYLPGIIPPEAKSPQKSNVETVVANVARRAGIAALIPRGRQGLAPKGRDRWWGWPTTDASYREHAGVMVATFAAQRKKLEEIAGVSFTRVYVAGSSSGAYFCVRLALRGEIEAHGFAAISGGALADATSLDRLEPKPFYFGYGKGEASVRRSVVALVDVFRRANWPVRAAEHPLDHGAHEVYLDEAIAFWREHDR
jgi:predicted esterase